MYICHSSYDRKPRKYNNPSSKTFTAIPKKKKKKNNDKWARKLRWRS
jgi:hypothetical protein